MGKKHKRKWHDLREGSSHSTKVQKTGSVSEENTEIHTSTEDVVSDSEETYELEGEDSGDRQSGGESDSSTEDSNGSEIRHENEIESSSIVERSRDNEQLSIDGSQLGNTTPSTSDVKSEEGSGNFDKSDEVREESGSSLPVNIKNEESGRSENLGSENRSKRIPILSKNTKESRTSLKRRDVLMENSNYAKFLNKLSASKPITVRNSLTGQITFDIAGKKYYLSGQESLKVSDLGSGRDLKLATELHNLIKSGNLNLD